MARVLTARRSRLPIAVLAVAAHLVVGLLVIALRIVRVAVSVATDAAMRAEQQLATRTGRPALSNTGIAVLARAFATEFLTAYRAPAR